MDKREPIIGAGEAGGDATKRMLAPDRLARQGLFRPEEVGRRIGEHKITRCIRRQIAKQP